MATASIATAGYVPPFAGIVSTAAAAIATALSTGAASQGGAYVPPFATGNSAAATPVVTSSGSTAYSTDGATDSSSFVDYFIIPYFDAHALSPSSYRYA